MLANRAMLNTWTYKWVLLASYGSGVTPVVPRVFRATSGLRELGGGRNQTPFQCLLDVSPSQPLFYILGKARRLNP